MRSGDARAADGQSGFTLVEALVAMFLLTVGVLGLAQVMFVGMRHLSAAAPSLVAREKAREAIERSTAQAPGASSCPARGRCCRRDRTAW